MARITLEQWINEAVHDPDKVDASGKRRACTAIVLVHMVGMQQKEVHPVKFGDQPPDAKALGAMFMRKAQNFVQDIKGVQTFNLIAFYGGTEPEASHPFIINSLGEDHNGQLATEGPTTQGALQMGMRHAEMIIQQAYRKQEVQDNTMMQLIGILSKENTMLRRENLDALTIVKQVIIDKANDAHKHKMEQLEFQRKSEERAKWLKFAPALINTLLGKEVFPQNVEDTAIIETVADNLTEEQAMKLSTMLPPEILGPMMGRIVRHLEAKKAREATMKQLTESVPVDTNELGE
jgi:hypothetical protein